MVNKITHLVGIAIDLNAGLALRLQPLDGLAAAANQTTLLALAIKHHISATASTPAIPAAAKPFGCEPKVWKGYTSGRAVRII
jgi:hypothetical protein